MVALATHALIGYTIGSVVFDAPRAGLIASLLPDIDLIVPPVLGVQFAHRGLTHSGFAIIVPITLAIIWTFLIADTNQGFRTAKAVGAGYGTHLLLDATTPMGVPLAAPVTFRAVALNINGHSASATAILWSGCLVMLWWNSKLDPAETGGA